MVIAKHYPKAMPSVATIGAEAKLSARQVQRILRIAEAAGLLFITHDGGCGRHRISKTSRYHLASLRGDISGEEMSHEGSPSENYSSSMSSPPRSNKRPHCVRSVAAATKETYEEPSRSVDDVALEEPEPVVWSLPDAVALANEYGRRERKLFQREPRWTSATSLVRYFAFGWKEFVNHHPMYADHRPFDSRGEAGKYLKDTFLAPTDGMVYTEEQVKEIIDEWFLGLVNLRNRIKPGQSAWRRFTATWQPPGGVSQQPSLEGEWWKK
jgi:hypothetical protein